MDSQDLEKAFSKYLEHKQYDKAENALLSITRAAFKAGWLAAGGFLPETCDKIRIVKADDSAKGTRY